MELFLKRSRGSITVLVTLILVPTIFFTGFLTDLSRLKLCGNQAVMAADNYGETVLTQYDNLLKELYGLFAVTQNEDGLKALDDLQAYMKTSFDPSSNGINWNHLEAIQDFAGMNEVEGFMPYRSAKVEMSYEFPENANLGDNVVLATQVGDFMRFRIAEQLLEDNTDLLDMLETVSNMEEDSKVIKKKTELDEKIDKLFEKIKEYYEILKVIDGYPAYRDGVNAGYNYCVADIKAIYESDSYKRFAAYKSEDPEAIKSALDHRQEIEDYESSSHGEESNTTEDGEGTGEGEAGSVEESPAPDPLSDEEERLCAISDAYTGDPYAQEDYITQKFTYAAEEFTSAVKNGDIRLDNFDDKVADLTAKAKEITDYGSDICKLMNEIQTTLDDESVTQDLKDGLKDDLDKMEGLFGSDKLQLYALIAEHLSTKDSPVNAEYSQTVETATEEVNKVITAYLKPEDCEWNPAEKLLEESKWNDFKSVIEQKKLYDELIDTFDKNAADEKTYEEKKDAAKEAKGNAEKKLAEDDSSTTARDIPAEFGYGNSGDPAVFNLTDMIGTAADMFSINKFKSNVNMLLLKFYTVQYDFGMFSSRVTNVWKNESDPDPEPAVSLTGYEMSRKINYLYQAELEYLLGGNNSSKNNLTEAKNKILAIRTVMNFTSTYAISEVNEAINAIRDAATAINPILGIAVGAALRLAVTGIETAGDWEELKKGNDVVLIKQHLKDLTSYDAFASLLNKDAVESAEDSCVRLDYEQYLKLMIVFLTSTDEVMNRTRNLIELNVNAADAGLKEDENLTSLSFHMKDAHTAVNATCTVHLDFLVMPEGFARKAASRDDYNSLMEFEKNSYKFTVTRGY